MARMRFPLWLVFGLLLCASCGDGSTGSGTPSAGSSNGKPVVLTTFYPTTYFATRIAGDVVDVRCPLPADADPIFWKPSAEAVASYQAADLIVVNGAELEKWVGQVSLPASRVVETAAGFRDQWVRYEEQTTHSHGPEGEHAHVGIDGHTWLDPQLAILQSRAIADALIELRPDHTAAFEAGFASLEQDLQELHAGFEALGTLPEGEFLYASHPAYNYLQERYGWRVVNLDLDPGEMPSEQSLADLKQRLQKDRGRYLIWEGEPDPAIASALQELGLLSLVISPCEGAPDAGDLDYLAQMRENIDRLAVAFDSGK